MKKYLYLLIICVLISCGGKQESIITDKVVYLNVNAEHIDKQIESITLLPFEVDDYWKYINAPLTTKIGDTIIFCTKESCHFLGYKENGEKVFSKHIKGRGRGEVLEVSNIFTRDNKICLFEMSTGSVMMYRDNGTFISKSENSFIEEYLYPLNNDGYVGLSSVRFDGSKYVSIYDNEGKLVKKKLNIPHYLKNQSMKFGQTPMSYCYKDSVRFMIPYNYNLFSVSSGSFESRFQFVTENPIPSEALDKLDPYMPVLDKLQLIAKYDDDFQGLFEMNDFLFFYYSGTHVLYNKHADSVYKTDNPQKRYNKTLAFSLSIDEIWQYLISSFLPLYSDNNNLYGRLPSSFYDLLKDCQKQLDSRLTSLLQEMDDYYRKYKLLPDDVIIVKLTFDEK